MSGDRLRGEKLRANAMRRHSDYPEQDYWLGYRLGLAARHEEHDALLTCIGSPDEGRDARGRGYRDGIAYREGLELLGTTEVAALLGWSRGRVAVYRGRGKLPAPVAELAQGPVWRRADVERYKREIEEADKKMATLDARTSLARWAEGIDHTTVAAECGENPAAYQEAYARILEELDLVDGWEAVLNSGSATDYGAQASYRYRYDSAEYTIRLDHEGAVVVE